MSDLTKRMRELADLKYQFHTVHAPVVMRQAADRIDALEEFLRELAQCNVGPNGYYSYPLRDLRDKARVLLEGK